MARHHNYSAGETRGMAKKTLSIERALEAGESTAMNGNSHGHSNQRVKHGAGNGNQNVLVEREVEDRESERNKDILVNDVALDPEELEAERECAELIPKPLDGGYGWVVCLAAMMLNFILDGIGYAFSVFIPAFQDAFHGASKSEVAWIGALLGGVYMLSGPIASALVNKFGCRLVSIGGALFTTSAFIAASQSTTLIGMIITFGVLGGFGFGLIYLPSIVSVGHYFQLKRALATGVTVCGSSIGMFVFAPLSEFLLEQYDLRTCIIWLAAIVLQGVWIGALLVPLDKKQPRQYAAKRRCTKPRSKNRFDRICEAALSWIPRRHVSQRSRTYQSAVQMDNRAQVNADEHVLDAVRKAREARQARLDADATHVQSTKKRSDSITNADGAVIGGQLSETERPSGRRSSARNGGDTDSASEATETISNSIRVSAGDSMVRNNRLRLISAGGGGSGSHMASLQRVYAPNDKAGSHLLLPNSARIRLDSEIALRSTLESLSSLTQFHRAHDALRHPDAGHIHSVHMQHDLARPLYRKDIFYSGSLAQIDQFQLVERAREEHPEVVPPNAYTASVTCIPVHHSIGGDHQNRLNNEPAQAVDTQSQRSRHLFSCIPRSVTDVLEEMLNFELLRIPAFALLLVGNLFAMFGFTVPFIYMVDLARGFEDSGNSPPPALLLTFCGATNTLGRVLCGWASSQPSVNGLMLHNVTLTIAGILTAFVPLLRSYSLLAAYALAYGFFISPLICLTSVILCDVVGVQSLTNSFGLLCLVRGIVTIASSPFAGFLFDLTNSYSISFLVSAGALLCGAFCHFLLHIPALQTENMRQQIASRRAQMEASKKGKTCHASAEADSQES